MRKGERKRILTRDNFVYMLGEWNVEWKRVIKGKEAYGCQYLWASSKRKSLSKERSTLYHDSYVDFVNEGNP